MMPLNSTVVRMVDNPQRSSVTESIPDIFQEFGQYPDFATAMTALHAAVNQLNAVKGLV